MNFPQRARKAGEIPGLRSPRGLNLAASRRRVCGLDATDERSLPLVCASFKDETTDGAHLTRGPSEVKAGCVGQAKEGGHADCLKAQLGLVRRPVVNGWKGCSPPGWGGFGKNAPNPPDEAVSVSTWKPDSEEKR